MSPTTEPDWHDRTLRFMATAFQWEAAPSHDAVADAAGSVTVIVHARPDRSPGQRLPLLALTNILGRLPVAVRFEISDCPLEQTPPPFEGERIVEVMTRAGHGLPGGLDIGALPRSDSLQATIQTPIEAQTWTVLANGWTAGLERGDPPVGEEDGCAVGAYLAACALGGEVLRAWARYMAQAEMGRPGRGFTARTAAASSRLLDFGPAPLPELLQLPLIDWASAGAVNQATLAVLAALPDIHLDGRVIDPKRLDPPDLNRSLLTFVDNIELAKAAVVGYAVGLPGLEAYYPDDIADDLAPWVVTGTDDPQVRVRVQQRWPEMVIVTATEDVFGLNSWHSRAADEPCAACDIEENDLPQETMPTSAPTSAAVGVLSAARLLQLAASQDVPHRTELLTLRLDGHGASESVWEPARAADCPICQRA